MDVRRLLQTWSTLAGCSRFRFWPMMAFLVVIIILLQLFHISLLSRLEEQMKQTRIPADRHLRHNGRMILNVLSEMEDRVKNSFRLDKSGTYHLLDNFLTSEHVTVGRGLYDVTIVSQSSSNNLHHIVELAQRWNGPISVAVFTFDDDFLNTVYRLVYFHFCFDHVFRHVSFHIAFPISRAPKDIRDISRIFSEMDCSNDSKSFFLRDGTRENYNHRDVEYPINLVRNLAINYVQTPYIFVIDFDILPSANLRSDFQKFLASRTSSAFSNETVNRLDAFVIPVFEFQSSVNSSIPSDKTELLKAWSKGEVQAFYRKVCRVCQQQTDYQAWRSISKEKPLQIAYTKTRVHHWEPFFITKSSLMPLYDERFKQYGFNRISQVCEMHIAGYKFHVMNNAFLVHKGFKKPGQFHQSKALENDRNHHLYQQVKRDLVVRYPGVNRTCE